MNVCILETNLCSSKFKYLGENKTKRFRRNFDNYVFLTLRQLCRHGNNEMHECPAIFLKLQLFLIESIFR